MAISLTRRLVPLLAGMLLAFPAADAESESYQPDWADLARYFVHDSLRLVPEERVILHYDPGHIPQFVAALRAEIIQAGGIISAELTWPRDEAAKYLSSLSPADKVKRAAAEDAIYRELFARSDVYLWIDVPGSPDLVWRRFEHLIGGSKVRAIHSHWFEPADPAEHDTVFRMYERAIKVPAATVDAILGPLEAKLRGAKLRLTSPEGTDLKLRIAEDAWFHRNTGEATRAKVATARSVRDREEELPAGVLRTTGVIATEGRLVARLPEATIDQGVVLTFHQGRIVDVQSRGGAGDEFAKWFREAGGDKDRVSELVIGTNPFLQPILPSGFMPYYGYGAGIVRIAVGDNWESGGTLTTSDHEDWWFFVTDGSLTANAVKIIDRGKLR